MGNRYMVEAQVKEILKQKGNGKATVYLISTYREILPGEEYSTDTFTLYIKKFDGKYLEFINIKDITIITIEPNCKGVEEKEIDFLD